MSELNFCLFVFFRESLDKLSQRGQLLSEEGHGAGKEARLCSQLLTNYQNLLRRTKEKLRSCQMALQEHEALEEALQSMWSCVKDMQGRLACAESTVGGRDALERQLSQVQVRGLPARHGCLRKTLSRFTNASLGSSLFCEPPREHYVGRWRNWAKRIWRDHFSLL